MSLSSPELRPRVALGGVPRGSVATSKRPGCPAPLPRREAGPGVGLVQGGLVAARGPSPEGRALVSCPVWAGARRDVTVNTQGCGVPVCPAGGCGFTLDLRGAVTVRPVVFLRAPFRCECLPFSCWTCPRVRDLSGPVLSTPSLPGPARPQGLGSLCWEQGPVSPGAGPPGRVPWGGPPSRAVCLLSVKSEQPHTKKYLNMHKVQTVQECASFYSLHIQNREYICKCNLISPFFPHSALQGLWGQASSGGGGHRGPAPLGPSEPGFVPAEPELMVQLLGPNLSRAALSALLLRGCSGHCRR